jgi:RimJ/RimL family protein N-acetyltransferase
MQPAPDYLLTSRLKLRRWQESDLPPFAKLNESAEVMRHFPNVLTAEESNAMVGKITKHFAEHELGLWAVELLGSCEFIGFVGLQRPGIKTLFTPCVEVGWRLQSDFWGNGYAVEAARTAMKDGFTRLELSEIVSMTSLLNTPSIRVMQKLGMVRDTSEDFDHPNIKSDNKLCRHLLYRLSTGEFSANCQNSES